MKHHVHRHAGAFFVIACFALTCTLLSTLAAGAQPTVGAAVPMASGATSAIPGTAPGTRPNNTAPYQLASPAVATHSAPPVAIGSINCAPSTISAGGCVPGTTRSPIRMVAPPATGYPLNPPAGNGQPGS